MDASMAFSVQGFRKLIEQFFFLFSEFAVSVELNAGEKPVI